MLPITATTDTPESPAISDALEILKFLAKLPSEYDGTGLTPDISHALDILKYLAKLEPTVNWVRPSVTSEVTETTVTTPRFPPLEPLSEEIELRIRQDWVDTHIKFDALPIPNIEQVRIHRYFGTYDGRVVVVMLDGNPFGGTQTMDFYGKKYRELMNIQMWVWSDGIFYRMAILTDDLLYREFFTEQDIEEIFYHYPLDQDLYRSHD
jgi:hypothetical protein